MLIKQNVDIFQILAQVCNDAVLAANLLYAMQLPIVQ